jgi:hypothetical protein
MARKRNVPPGKSAKPVAQAPSSGETPLAVPDKVGRPDIDSFEAALQREKRTTGFFVAFDYPSDAMTEIGAFFKRTGIIIRALTVKDILDEQIARKLV